MSGSYHFSTGSLQQRSGPPPWLHSQTHSTPPYGRDLTCHSLVKICQWLLINYVIKFMLFHMVDTALWRLATTSLSLHLYLYCTSSSFSWMVFQLPFPSSESQTFVNIWRHLLITIGGQVLMASSGSSFRMLLIMLQCKELPNQISKVSRLRNSAQYSMSQVCKNDINFPTWPQVLLHGFCLFFVGYLGNSFKTQLYDCLLYETFLDLPVKV